MHVLQTEHIVPTLSYEQGLHCDLWRTPEKWLYDNFRLTHPPYILKMFAFMYTGGEMTSVYESEFLT